MHSLRNQAVKNTKITIDRGLSAAVEASVSTAVEAVGPIAVAAATEAVGSIAAVPPLPLGRDFPWLAPLAGFSDLPFRLLCREMGAAVACTEMVSAKGLVFGYRQGGKGGAATDDLVSTVAEDTPLVVQLFGAEKEYLSEAVRILQDRGFCYFDLNMGCSVPKVTKTGAGAAMLKDTANAVAVVEAMVAAATTGVVGCKIRLGWDVPVFMELGQALEEAGVAWLTLHPRYARQGFSGTPHYEALQRLAQARSIPILASGDLFQASDAVRCMQETGVAGVMFARGAMGNPAIFSEYKALMNPACSPSAPVNLLSLIRRHALLAQELTPGKPGRKGLSPALLKMRTVVPRYVKHLPGAKQLRLALAGCESWEHLEAILHAFFMEDQGS